MAPDLVSAACRKARTGDTEAVRADVRPNVFTQALYHPVGGSPGGGVAKIPREGAAVDEGSRLRYGERKLVDSKTGAQFTLELLGADPSFGTSHAVFQAFAERLGIAVGVRSIDPTQYENRFQSWDFDVVVPSAAIVVTGNEQREY